MKVWITKYALTNGIIETNARKSLVFENSIVIKPKYPILFDDTTFEAGEWFLDRESAIAKAEEMRQKKIESLKKQIQKLEVMKFE